MLSGRALTLRVASAARSYFLLSLFSRFLSFSLVPLSPFPSLLFSPFPLSPPCLPLSCPLSPPLPFLLSLLLPTPLSPPPPQVTTGPQQYRVKVRVPQGATPEPLENVQPTRANRGIETTRDSDGTP